MIFKDSYYLRTGHFDKIVIENNIPLAWIVKLSQFKGDIYYHFIMYRVLAEVVEVYLLDVKLSFV